MSGQISTILTALIAGLAAFGGTVGGAYLKGDADQRVAQENATASFKLSQQKFHSDLVMKALESPRATERLDTLKLLAETRIISDESIRDAIRQYAADNAKNPQNVPQVVRASTTDAAPPPPLTQNARLFLLAGNVQKATQFEALQRDLANAAYRVLGAKTLTDPGRPDRPEIRYFNLEDEANALQIRDYMRDRLGDATVTAQRYQDSSARPGYVEVWLGR